MFVKANEDVYLHDIKMGIAAGEIKEIPLNLSRRSSDLQAAFDRGALIPAPTDEAKLAAERAKSARKQKRRTTGRSAPRRPVSVPNLHQQVSELRSDVARMGEEMGRMWEELKALRKVRLPDPREISGQKSEVKMKTKKRKTKKRKTKSEASEKKTG